MTVGAGRNRRITGGGQSLTVTRTPVLRYLIDTKRWVVLTHELGIGVAPPAHLDGLLAVRNPEKSESRVHTSHALDRRVAAVAIHASESGCRVDIQFELRHRVGGRL